MPKTLKTKKKIKTPTSKLNSAQDLLVALVRPAVSRQRDLAASALIYLPAGRLNVS